MRSLAKNYRRKKLRPMSDIASQTTLITGHPWPELKEIIREQVQKSSPTIHAVQEVALIEPPPIVLSYPRKSVTFSPHQARHGIAKLLDANHPQPNPNRIRLSGSAKTLTFGAQTGRASEKGCVIKRTHEQKYSRLIQVVHKLAQSVIGAALPYLGLQLLKLERGQNLNQHRDYHNHPEYPNHTMKFGDNVWLSFDALKVTIKSLKSSPELATQSLCRPQDD